MNRILPSLFTTLEQRNPLTKLNNIKGFYFSLSMMGLIFGFVCFYISMYPMLLPRTWWLQAIGSGISGSIGYAVGKMLATCVDWAYFCFHQPKMRLRHRIQQQIFAVLLGFAVILAIYRWYIVKQISMLMDMPIENLALTLLSLLGGLLIWLALLLLARGLVLLAERIVHLLVPNLPIPIQFLTWIAVSVLMLSAIWEVSRNYIWQPTLQKISQSALQLHQTQPKQLQAPQSPFKSGFVATASAKPAQSWQQLGHYGQRFVSFGLSADEIQQVTGRPAKEPIRVFVGLDNHEPSAALLSEIVQVALQELDRTQAWQRQYLVIHGATGRGWVEEYSSLAVEYLTDGDVASVAVQYSYLPSQVSFLLDREASKQINRQLIQAIEQRLAKLDPEQRPKLMLAGESLGAFATQSAFQGEADLIQRIDGAVWVGTPRLSQLWETLVQQRQTPSTEVQPIIQAGRHIRFMDRPEALYQPSHTGTLQKEWLFPRIVFVQYASDPIVWWSPKMLWQRPDWLTEQKGHDVVKLPTWLPVISLLELTLDMPASNRTPAGHGHIYRYDTVYAWQAVLNRPDAPMTKIIQAMDQRVAEKLPEKSD